MPIEINRLSGIPHSVTTNHDVLTPNQKLLHTENAAVITKDSSQVELSEQAVILEKLTQRLEQAPILDMEKITLYREAIQQGNYSINAYRIAQRLLDADNWF